jgi:NAD+ diphosphatase
MLGFSARHAGGDIQCDGSEIADARWFSRDDLPGLPGSISNARWLIEDWRNRSA